MTGYYFCGFMEGFYSIFGARTPCVFAFLCCTGTAGRANTIICHSCDYLYAFLRYLWSSSPWLRSKPWVQYSNLYSECELKAGVKRDPEGFGF